MSEVLKAFALESKVIHGKFPDIIEKACEIRQKVHTDFQSAWSNEEVLRSLEVLQEAEKIRRTETNTSPGWIPSFDREIRMLQEVARCC